MSEELVGRTPEAEETHKEFLSQCKANLQEEELRMELVGMLVRQCDEEADFDDRVKEIWDWLKGHGYVQLDEEQELPPKPRSFLYLNDSFDLVTSRETVWDMAQRDMLKANFRRIKK